MDNDIITTQKHDRRTTIIVRVVIIIAIFAAAAACAFIIFRIHSNGRFALREAKNIRLALVATDIELYPSGNTIYAPERANGLAPGVIDSVKRLADVNGELMLVSYDKVNREIRRMTYKTDRYLVTYVASDDGKESWKVDYLWKILDY